MRNDEQSIKQKPLIIYGACDITRYKEMITYHKKFPVLVPFDYYNKTKIQKELIWNEWWNYLFMDSGAFSVSQKNASIDIKQYIRFIKENEDKINNYASLDVVGNGEQSLHNWKIMRKAGLFPISVFHDGEDLDILKEYCDNCSYIGLGAVAYKSNKSRNIFFDYIFNMYPNRSKIGFHGFGVMDLGMLLRYPWKSIDSSTIAVAARFGEIIYGSKLERITISKTANKIKRDKNCNNGIKEEIIKQQFKKYNRNYDMAIQGTKQGSVERIFFNLDSFNEYAKIPNEFNPVLRINSLL